MFNAHLALDFDGVIANSISECLVVGHNAFARYSGKKNLVEELNELDPNRVEESRRLRNFIRYGEDYVYINLALEDGAKIRNQKEFDDFTRQYESLRPEFVRLFYDERTRLSTEQKELWVRLNPLYEGMTDFLIDFPKDRLYVITTKRIAFVELILQANGVLLKEENLFHANVNHSKREIIRDILKRDAIPARDFHFVDDQVDTLLKVRDLGIVCYLAEWGYNNAEQIRRAKEEGIQVLNLPEFYELFSGA